MYICYYKYYPHTQFTFLSLFVVVFLGDHCQLPPTIKSGRAEKGGLGVTLFERIIRDSRFQAVVRLLDTQYRMNRRISDWASVNMYHGAIRSHPSVAEHTLRDILPGEGGSPTDPNKNTTSSSTDSDSSGDEDDVSSVQPPTSAQKTDQGGEELYPVLLLVDTSGLGMFEDSSLETAGSGETKKLSASHRNFHEADLVRQHVLSLVRAGKLCTDRYYDIDDSQGLSIVSVDINIVFSINCHV